MRWAFHVGRWAPFKTGPRHPFLSFGLLGGRAVHIHGPKKLYSKVIIYHNYIVLHFFYSYYMCLIIHIILIIYLMTLGKIFLFKTILNISRVGLNRVETFFLLNSVIRIVKIFTINNLY